MKMCWMVCLAFWMSVAAPSASAADGTFSGKVVDPPASEPAVSGWIFVQGKNHMLRRVEVAHATIVFGEEVPARQRRKCDSECLNPGQEVRITAHQDSSGEWRAKRVEILSLTTRMAETPLKAGLYQTLPAFGLLSR